MTPDDPRHGTVAGHIAHRRDGQKACLPCVAAKTRYEKIRNLYGDRMVPAIGTRRRIRALKALGHSGADIGKRLGVTYQAVHKLEHGKAEVVFNATAENVRRVYAEMCMSEPAGYHATRIRNQSARNGYAPPLAWNNIDDPDELPNLGGRDDEIDPVVVDRLLARQRVPSTRAEKVEAMRRWVAMGKSQAALCAIHGWKQGRYMEREDGAA